MSDVKAGFSSANEALPLPRAFGRLLLLKLIARGGMGDVYLAATTGIEGAERPCVVKTIRRDHMHDGSFLARFLDEARVQSQLNHPGVAQVLEASTDENNEPFTVVEYVEGRSLAEVRQRAIQIGVRIGWAEAVAIALEVGQALAHVHERAGADGTPLGIVHRDLSPQNVMIGFAGETKLIDFGTARGHNRRCHTVAGVVFAKPGYVAPEVARQQVGDGRIDLYALGIIVWELCSARRFLQGDAQKHLEDVAAGSAPVTPIAQACGAPPLLDTVIGKLTANDPDARYPSAALAVLDLARVLAEAPAGRSGERGVRARIATAMRVLWPNEPTRSRGEFARLLKQARSLRDDSTPSGGRAMQLAAAHMADDPGLLLGTPYRMVRKIGEGASGVVHEAEHIELGRKVALKVLADAHAGARDAVERFRREARAVAGLSHPNLVPLYDFGRALDGRVFLAMELLSGETIDRRLRRTGPCSWREAARIGVQVARALEAAHDAGLVHRDLKPANLFMTDAGVVKLLDFGVAVALSDSARDSQRQRGFAIFGTPEYMAPEQVAGEAVDARCDIYALGCVLYELVTGHPVFEGESSVVIMGKQLREAPAPPRERASGIPASFEQIVMRTLAKRPADRYASAASLRDALERELSADTRQRSWVRVSTVFAGAVAAAAALAAGGQWLVAHSDPAPAAPVRMPSAPPAKTAASTPVVAPGRTLSTPEGALAPAAASTVSLSVVSAAHAGTTLSRDRTPRERAEARAERERSLLEARTYARVHGNDARALRAWAQAAQRAGEGREARDAAEAWMARDPSAEPRIFMATLLDGAARRAEARAVLETWLAQHPDSADVRHLLSKMSTARR